MGLIFITFLCIFAASSKALDSRDLYKQLDELDRSMTEKLGGSDALCEMPDLGYCKQDVDYPVAKVQSSMHSFYDGLVESAFDSLTLLTKGSVLSCKRDLKRLLCRERFPRCNGNEVDWGKGKDRCGKVVEKCPQDVRDILNQFNFCAKFNEGKKHIKTCTAPLLPDSLKYCVSNETEAVSPWNYHSAIEVNGLLEMQTSLWKLSKPCLKALSKYLCYPATSCWDGKETAKLVQQYDNLCKSTVASCSKEVISRALRDIFLSCK